MAYIKRLQVAHIMRSRMDHYSPVNDTWHNNTAEGALRHLVVQEKISGFFYESLVPDYLLLLGIRQTCRFQGKSFLRFLFSEEKDIDKFDDLDISMV